MNRKQRRAKNSTDDVRTADEIPLHVAPYATKSRNKKIKTLYDIAAERQAELLGSGPIDTSSLKPENIVQVKIGKDGEIVTDKKASLPASSSEEGETPWLDVILLSVSLSAVHFTLSVLTMHQYAEKLRFPPLIWQTLFIALPTLLFLISLFHGQLLPSSFRNVAPSIKNGAKAARSLVYVVTANVAGCYLIQLTNDRGYYAVMKDAPSVGTIWVWAVLEMGLLGALAGVVGPALYAWWFGYAVY